MKQLEGREAIMEDNFRHNTRLWRMRRGLSQRAVSEQLGGHSMIFDYERYALIALDPGLKQRYADILGIPIQALYKDYVEMPVHLTDIDQAICRDNLEAIRKAHGNSIPDFAEQIGVSSAAYNAYCHGGIISLHCFWVIVDHLDIDPWLLATGKTHKEG
jgi:transcriptional regulator with XRE-family HTH domain